MEVVPGFVEGTVAIPRSRPAAWGTSGVTPRTTTASRPRVNNSGLEPVGQQIGAHHARQALARRARVNGHLGLPTSRAALERETARPVAPVLHDNLHERFRRRGNDSVDSSYRLCDSNFERCQYDFGQQDHNGSGLRRRNSQCRQCRQCRRGCRGAGVQGKPTPSQSRSPHASPYGRPSRLVCTGPPARRRRGSTRRRVSGATNFLLASAHPTSLHR